MARPPDFKRITTEDFTSAEQKQFVKRLAFPINSFFEQVRNILNKNIDFQNLNQEIQNVNVTVNGSGLPTPSVSVRTTVSGKVQGVVVLYAANQDDSSSFPTTAPFISFTPGDGFIKINHISGLQNGEEYLLRLLIYGN